MKVLIYICIVYLIDVNIKVRNTLFVIAILFLPVIFYYLLNTGINHYKPLKIFGPEGHTIPSFQLTSQEGKTLSLIDMDNKICIVDFIFTSCAGICPVMTSEMNRVQKVLGKYKDVLLFSFTVDPETDTPEILSEYAKGQGALSDKWYFVTGDKKEIYTLARKGFFLPVDSGDGGPLDFIHSEKLVLIDKKQRIRGYYDGTNPGQVDSLMGDVMLLLVPESK